MADRGLDCGGKHFYKRAFGFEITLDIILFILNECIREFRPSVFEFWPQMVSFLQGFSRPHIGFVEMYLPVKTLKTLEHLSGPIW